MTREESRLTARAGRAPARRSGGKIPDNLAKSRGISGNLGLLLDDQVERAVEITLQPLLLPLPHVLGTGGEEAEAGAPC